MSHVCSIFSSILAIIQWHLLFTTISMEVNLTKSTELTADKDAWYRGILKDISFKQ